MEKDLISIIIPVYKVEQYLDRCIESVIHQTYKNLEIILVDDGSPDNCPEMCDDWAKKDNRIRVIHKTNGGLSSARNAGVAISHGKYIGFVDSDDWIARDMFETLYRAIVTYNAEVAQIDVLIAESQNEKFDTQSHGIEVFQGEEIYKRFFRVSTDKIRYFAWDKLYRADIAKKVSFWEGMLFEDIDYNFKIIEEINKLVFVKKIEYFWFYNVSSITRNGIRHGDMQLIQIWENIMDKCKDRPTYEYYATMNRDRAYMGLLAKSAKFGVDKKNDYWVKDKEALLKGVRSSFKKLMKWKMPINRKLLLILLCINPNLVSIPFRILDHHEK